MTKLTNLIERKWAMSLCVVLCAAITILNAGCDVRDLFPNGCWPPECPW